MKGTVMIDAGRGGRLCTGELAPMQNAPVLQIGRELCSHLQAMGCKTLFSEELPELNDPARERGRPALCAELAKRRKVNCLLRLCVREAEIPILGSACATVHRGDRSARSLAEMLLRRIDIDTELNAAELHTTSGVLLLRRAPCPSVILLLRLPFPQTDCFTHADATLYSSCLSKAICTWFEGLEG